MKEWIESDRKKFYSDEFALECAIFRVMRIMAKMKPTPNPQTAGYNNGHRDRFVEAALCGCLFPSGHHR